MNKLFALIPALLLLVGCNYGQQKSLQLEPLTAPTTASASLSYKLVLERALQKSCVGCHSTPLGNKGGLNLETYENIFANKDEIRSRVSGRTMPPASVPALSNEQVDLILAWIDSGAPRVPGDPPPTPVELPVVEPPVVEPPVVEPPISFDDVRTQVLQVSCTTCHAKFVNYEKVFPKIKAIKSLIESGAMPMGGVLTDQQKSLILNWIEAGAPEKP